LERISGDCSVCLESKVIPNGPPALEIVEIDFQITIEEEKMKKRISMVLFLLILMPALIMTVGCSKKAGST
jgi:hypothetical protein